MTVPYSPPSVANLEALEVLRNASSFLLVGHERPDGDCIGSQVALARVLARMGKVVVVMNPDPPGAQFGFLTDDLDFRTYGEDPLPSHDVCVLLDINTLSRTGAMRDALGQAPSTKLVVDHHVPSGDPWWDAAFIDTGASATGLLVARIAKALEVDLDLAAAEAVFTAIVTDTGWLKYSNTDPETMALAAQLVSIGVVPVELHTRLYQQNSAELPGAIAAVLGGLNYECDGRLAVIEHPLASSGAAILDDADPVLDIVRAVARVEVVIYLREMEDGRCKLSLRSKTDFDVNALAAKFGGGGHKKASGATIEGSLQEIRSRIADAATRMLRTDPLEGAGKETNQ